MIAYDALILSGGHGTRLGGVSKAGLVVGGRPLLHRVLAAVSGADAVVVVGDAPSPLPPGLRVPHVTREDPPGSGPAAGTVAGLALLDALPHRAPWTVLLACDLPEADEGVPPLLAAAATTVANGVCLSHPDGTPQWLFGAFRSAELVRAAAALGDPTNRSMRALLAPLALDLVAAPEGASDDMDTWADVAAWHDRHGG